MSINNISTEAKANGSEGVDAGNAVETTNNASINNDNAIASISYTAGQGVPKNQDVNSQNFLKTVENFGELVNAEEIPNEVFEQICDNTKGVLTVLPEAIKEVCAQGGMTFSKEVTEEDLQIQKEAQERIDKLLSDGSISDFDIRELMKILIKAFSALMNAQREIELNTMKSIIGALESKITAMEESKDANRKAAITQAVGQIVSGVIQITAAAMSIASSSLQGAVKNETFQLSNDKYVARIQNVLINSGDPQAILKLGSALGEIITGITGAVAAGQQSDAKSADILSTVADMLMEISRKMQEAVSTALSKLMEYIATLLQTMSSLIQSASSTEKTIVA